MAKALPVNVYYNPALGDIKAQIDWLIANGDPVYQGRSRSYIALLAVKEWVESKFSDPRGVNFDLIDPTPREAAFQFIHSPRTYNIKSRIGDLKKLTQDLAVRSESSICLLALRDWLSTKGIPADLPAAK